MAIDSTKFGLTKDIEVKFFTPEEAASIPGASAGYNTVLVIKEGRVRYEPGVSIQEALNTIINKNLKESSIKQVVEQQKPQKAPKQKAVEPEVKPVEVKVVEETTPEVAEPQE